MCDIFDLEVGDEVWIDDEPYVTWIVEKMFINEDSVLLREVDGVFLEMKPSNYRVEHPENLSKV